jgi:hypothetical protein
MRNGQPVITWGPFSGAGNHDAPRGAKRKPQTDMASDPRREKQAQSFTGAPDGKPSPLLKAK